MTINPTDGLVVPRDLSALSESTRQWLAELGPVQNTPQDVMAQHVRAAKLEEDREDKERERRRTDALAEREDAESLSILRGEFAETVTAAERLRDLAAINEIQEYNEQRTQSTRAQKLAEERAIAAERQIAALQDELAKERYEHSRASWLAADRLDGWMAARARADEQGGYSQPSSYRYRTNYWE